MTAARKLPIVGPLAYSPEWYQLRVFDPDRPDRKVIWGASDAANICGHGYKSRLQVYMEQRGEMPAKQDTDEVVRKKRFGKKLEQPILDEYGEQLGATVLGNVPILFSEEYPFLAATPDALIMHSETRGYANIETSGVIKDGKLTEKFFDVTHLADAKNSTSRMFDKSGEDEDRFGREGTDEVPLGILFQGQHQMAVTGLNRVDFAALFDGYYLRIYRVERNEDLIKQIAACGKEMSERIINGDPPDPDLRDDRTASLLKSMYGCTLGKIITLPIDQREIFKRYEELGIIEKQAAEDRKELRNKLLHAAQDAQYVKFDESDIILKRIVVADSIVTEKDVEALQARIGQVGRSGHIRLQRTKSIK